MRIWLYMNIDDLLEPFNMLYHVLNAAEMKSFKFKASNRPSSWTDSSQVKRQFVSKLTIFEKTLSVSWTVFWTVYFQVQFQFVKMFWPFCVGNLNKKTYSYVWPPIKTVRGNGRSSNWTVNLLLLHFVYMTDSSVKTPFDSDIWRVYPQHWTFRLLFQSGDKFPSCWFAQSS